MKKKYSLVMKNSYIADNISRNPFFNPIIKKTKRELTVHHHLHVPPTYIQYVPDSTSRKD